MANSLSFRPQQLVVSAELGRASHGVSACSTPTTPFRPRAIREGFWIQLKSCRIQTAWRDIASDL